MLKRRSFLNQFREDANYSVLCLFAMLLQLIFSTAHIVGQSSHDGSHGQSDGAFSFWEICSGQGLIELARNPLSPVSENLHYDSCSVCFSAAVDSGLALSHFSGISGLFTALRQSRLPARSDLFAFKLYPRAGASRAPPVV